MNKNIEVNGSGSNYKDKIIKRLFFKNLNRVISYLNLKARVIFT